jgi:serine/threonine protein phosphatase PrpC
MEEPIWENLAEKLVAQANENGGHDNVTVVLMRNQE